MFNNNSLSSLWLVVLVTEFRNWPHTFSIAFSNWQDLADCLPLSNNHLIKMHRIEGILQFSLGHNSLTLVAKIIHYSGQENLYNRVNIRKNEYVFHLGTLWHVHFTSKRNTHPKCNTVIQSLYRAFFFPIVLSLRVKHKNRIGYRKIVSSTTPRQGKEITSFLRNTLDIKIKRVQRENFANQ